MIESMTTSDVKATLRQMWNTLLGEESFADTDDFYKSGGNSLKALILMTEMNNQFELTIGFEQLVGQMTIDKLADLIQKNLSVASSEAEASSAPAEATSLHSEAVVFLNEFVKGRDSLILVHDVSGHLNGYMGLVELCREQFNCVGLKLPTTDSVAPRRIELIELVQQYRQLLTGVIEDAGNIVVLGWSLGGVLGFELLKLVDEQTSKLKALLMLDPPWLNDSEQSKALWSNGTDVELTKEQEQDLLAELSASLGLNIVPESHQSQEQFWQKLLQGIGGCDREALNQLLAERFPVFTRFFPHFARADAADVLQYLNDFRGLLSAASRYVVSGSLSVPIFYFDAAESENRFDGWQAHAGAEITSTILPGDHFAVFNEVNVRSVFQEIQNTFKK